MYMSTNTIGAVGCSCWEGFQWTSDTCVAVDLNRANYSWMLDGLLSVVDYSCRQGE